MKKCAENLIINHQLPSTIIRISAPLGPTMRENSLTKLISNQKLSLHKESNFNYILQKDILNSFNSFLKLSGVFDFYSTQNITLNEVAEKFNLKGKYGDFIYKTYMEDTNKIRNLYPFDKTSLQNIEIFLKDKVPICNKL